MKAKFGLDAKTSDYIYKHHIARLEDIYTHRRFEIKNPVRVLTMSPTAQLYGIHGLKSSMNVTSKKKREQTWVGNFQKYQALKEGDIPPRRMTASSSAPALGTTAGVATHVEEGDIHIQHGSLSGGAASLTGLHHDSIEDDDAASSQLSAVRRVTCEDTAPRCDLVAFGLYRLSPAQLDIYQRFVQMLTHFDTEDMRKIAEDAVGEAYTDHVLQEYSGIDSTIANTPAFID